MNKKKILVGFVIVIVVGLIVSLFFFFKGIVDDNKRTHNQIIEIKILSSNIDDYVSEFNNQRKTLSFLLTDTYTSNLKDRHDNIFMLLDKEEGVVREVQEVIHTMDKDCGDRIYSDSSANEICHSYKNTYEEMVNVFINDVSHINDMIDEYVSSYGDMGKYVSGDFDTYIDYDGDGVFSGKEDLDEEKGS